MLSLLSSDHQPRTARQLAAQCGLPLSRIQKELYQALEQHLVVRDDTVHPPRWSVPEPGWEPEPVDLSRVAVVCQLFKAKDDEVKDWMTQLLRVQRGTGLKVHVLTGKRAREVPPEFATTPVLAVESLAVQTTFLLAQLLLAHDQVILLAAAPDPLHYFCSAGVWSEKLAHAKTWAELRLYLE